MIPARRKGRIHIVIGDTQVKDGVPTDHLGWIGQYIVDKFAGTDAAIIHLGDGADMPSLSSFDKGKKAMEGRRYKADIRAANRGTERLCRPLEKYNAARIAARRWRPDMVYLLGNHEYRIVRAYESDAQLEGALSLDDLNLADHGFDVVPFLKPKVIDGISYCHYFYHPSTGKPYGGESLDTRLKNIGRSFTMGHQQGVKYAVRQVGATRHHGLVLGSSYLHDEEYLGFQGNAYWRGIVVCHQVERGTYDPMFVSLDYLCRRYEGKTLKAFMKGWESKNRQAA